MYPFISCTGEHVGWKRQMLGVISHIGKGKDNVKFCRGVMYLPRNVEAERAQTFKNQAVIEDDFPIFSQICIPSIEQIQTQFAQNQKVFNGGTCTDDTCIIGLTSSFTS